MNKRTCSIEGCERPVHNQKRGWCVAHYRRWQRHGDPLAGAASLSPAPADGLCTINDCERKHKARGWCRNHYELWKRHGTPHGRVRYGTPEGSFGVRTEHQGDCLVWTGATSNDGYGQIAVAGATQRAHRWAWERANGPIPEGLVVDHICHNPPCVKIEHLRLATFSQNRANLSGPTASSVVGVRNVSKSGDGWVVRIKLNGEIHYFGHYRSLEEAAKVAELARAELFGEFAGRG